MAKNKNKKSRVHHLHLHPEGTPSKKHEAFFQAVQKAHAKAYGRNANVPFALAVKAKDDELVSINTNLYFDEAVKAFVDGANAMVKCREHNSDFAQELTGLVVEAYKTALDHEAPNEIARDRPWQHATDRDLAGFLRNIAEGLFPGADVRVVGLDASGLIEHDSDDDDDTANEETSPLPQTYPAEPSMRDDAVLDQAVVGGLDDDPEGYDEPVPARSVGRKRTGF